MERLGLRLFLSLLSLTLVYPIIEMCSYYDACGLKLAACGLAPLGLELAASGH